MSWRKHMGVNSTLEDLRKVIKILHEEWEWIFIIWLFSFGISESTGLSIARWVLTYPTSEPISREWDYHLSWMWERPPWNIICILMECCDLIYEASNIHDPSLLPFSQSPLQYFHISLWWRTCVNGGCAPFRLVDSKAWVNYLCLCNIYSIMFVSLNQQKYICKCPHFQALLWLVSMCWFPISMVLYIWCMLQLGSDFLCC